MRTLFLTSSGLNEKTMVLFDPPLYGAALRQT